MQKRQAHDFHERFEPATGEVRAGSERGFGIVFGIAFAVVGLWPVWRGDSPRVWALAITAGFFVIALLAPSLLRPLNWAWFRLGILLGRIVSPVVMGLVYFLTVTPTALIVRLLGKDPLRLKADPSAASYWIARNPPGPARGTLKNQF
jgi:hypothetical protein